MLRRSEPPHSYAEVREPKVCEPEVRTRAFVSMLIRALPTMRAL
jgi:hypothetical protein